MKKKLKTIRDKKLAVMDIIAFIVCCIYSKLIWKRTFIEIIGICLVAPFVFLFKGYINIFILLRAYIYIILAVILLAIFFTLPINVIYLAIRKSYKSKIIQSTTFNSIEDIEYYREKFNNLSPAVISVVSDFEVEYKKDLSATIMSLYQKKNIEINDNSITVVSTETEKLDASERYVLNGLAANNKKTNISNIFNMFDKSKFENLGKEEAERKGFIVKKIDNKRLKITLGVLLILFLLCIKIVSIPNFYDKEFLDVALADAEKFENDMDFIESLKEKKIVEKYFDESSKQVIQGTSIFGIIIIPIYTLIFYKSYKKMRLEYKRTAEGNILMEKIYGMKNYIHDFSLLKDAQKEKIVLWDEFLIYAILLEENTQIIGEISKMKNIKLPNF